MKSVTITIPIPPRSLSPNGRPHHMARANARKRQKHDARYKALAAMGRNPQPRWPVARVEVKWYAKSRRWPDHDNALGSLKGAIDGLKDAGVILDDKDLHWPPMIERLKDAANPRVEITLTPLE